MTEEAGSADILEYDGLVNENAPRFRKTKTVEDAESSEDDLPPKFGDVTDVDFAAVEPDVAGAEFLGGFPTPAETREIVCDGRAPLAGWRRDDFGSNGLIRRSVWTPPWSLRPPHLEPEQWLSFNQR